MEDAEDYVSDHIVGRDFWVALKAWSERLSGKQENNGVYFGKEDTLINRLDDPGPRTTLMTSAGLCRRPGEQRGPYPSTSASSPPPATIWSDRLPAGAPTADEPAIIEELYLHGANYHRPVLRPQRAQGRGHLLPHRPPLDQPGGLLRLHRPDGGHGHGAAPLDEDAKMTVSDSFYGTTFSSSGVRWVAPDHIDRYIPGDGVKVTSYFDGNPTEGTLYVDSYLDKKDKYSYFLGGNQPLCVIETEHTDAPKVLVIRDSYSDSLAPFLTQNFSEIHLFDPRMNLNSVKDYVETNEIDQVVVLYSISNFISSSKDLFVLSR